jgi:nucleoside-diphosphate-sugar epimerase
MKTYNQVAIVSGSSFIAKETIRALKFNNKLNIISKTRLKTSIYLNLNHKLYYDNLIANKNIINYLGDSKILINFAYVKKNKTKNIILIRNLIRSINQSNIKRFIHVSTAVVSGLNQKSVLNEDAENIPISDYQVTKLKIEEELKKKLSRKIKLIIIRPTEVISIKNYTIIDKIIFRVKNFYICNYLINFFLKNRKINVVCLPNLVHAIIFLINKKNLFLRETYIISDSDIKINYGFFFDFINNFINIKYYRSIFSINLKLLAIIYKIILPSHSNPVIHYSNKKIQQIGYKKKISLSNFLIKMIKYKNI